MLTPTVSVLLPVYNARASLAWAVQSIFDQTLADWELLLVDDGSTDGSRSIAETFARQDPRVRCLVQPHGGIVSALNLGLAEARAPFIARMDADDESYPNRLAEQVRFIAQSEDLGLAGCLVKFGGDSQAAAGYALHVDWINSLVDPDSIALNRFVECPFAHPSVMFRRSFIERFGGYEQGPFPEDYEMWLRWLDAGVTVAKVPRILLTWNDSVDRLSRSDERYSTEAFYRCKAVYLARWLRRTLSPHRRILVWGAGRETRRRLEYLLAEGVEISALIDIDPRKIGRTYFGAPVIAAGDTPEADDAFVLGYVGKRGARDLARAHLKSRSYVEGQDFIMAA